MSRVEELRTRLHETRDAVRALLESERAQLLERLREIDALLRECGAQPTVKRPVRRYVRPSGEPTDRDRLVALLKASPGASWAQIKEHARVDPARLVRLWREGFVNRTGIRGYYRYYLPEQAEAAQ